MKAMKSLWVLLLVIGLLTETVVLLIYRSSVAAYTPWSWIAAGAFFLLILLSALLLRQQRALNSMRRVKPAAPSPKGEEPWKAKTRSDLDALAKRIDAFPRKKMVWILGEGRERMADRLREAGATPVSQEEQQRLSGELTAFCDILARGETCYFVPEISALLAPDGSGALHPKAALVLDVMARLREKPIDSIVLAQQAIQDESQAASTGEAQQKILSAILRHLSLDIPVYCVYTPDGPGTLLASLGEAMLSGHSSALELTPPTGRDLQERFSQIRQELDGQLDALLFKAQTLGKHPSDVMRLRGYFAQWENSALAHLGTVLSHYVGSERPLFRGFYLAPLGPSIGEKQTLSFGNIEADFGLDEEPGTKGLGTFLDFLEKDSSLSRFCGRRQKKQSLVAWALSFTLIAFSILLVISSLYSLVQLEQFKREWDNSFRKLGQVQWKMAAQTQEWMPAWDLAYDLYDRIENRRPWSIAPGYFNMGHRAESALDTYKHMYRSAYQATMVSLENNLLAMQSDSSLALDPLFYKQLRLYLVLANDSSAQTPEDSVALLTEQGFTAEMERKFGPLDEGTRAALATHLARMPDMELSYKVDPVLLSKCRQTIRSARMRSGDYDQLISITADLPLFGLDSLGLADDRLGKAEYGVQGAFTRAAYQAKILPGLSGEGGKPDWVLGAQLPEEQPLPGGDHDGLKRRYFAQYQEQWRSFLDQSAIRMPSDLQAGAGVLAMLASPYAKNDPKGLRAFVKGVCANLDLRPNGRGADSLAGMATGKLGKTLKKIDKVADKIEGMTDGSSPEEELLNSLPSPCQLDSLIGKNRLDAYFKDLTQLAGVLGQANGGDQASLDFARSLLAQDVKNPLVHAWQEIEVLLQSFPVADRTWISSVFQGPLKSLAEALLPAVAAKAQQDYQERVFKPFQSELRNSYPFSRHSSREASVDEVTAFFHPQTGNIAKFFQGIDGILYTESGKLVPKYWNGVGLALQAQAGESLRKSKRLTDALFGSSGQWRGYTVTLEAGAPRNASVELEINGNRLEIPMGSEKRIQFKWPQSGGNGFSIRVKTPNKDYTENYTGEWSLLKLMQKPGATAIPGGKQTIFSFHDKSYIIDVPVRIKFDNSVNPGNNPDLFEIDLTQDLFAR